MCNIFIFKCNNIKITVCYDSIIKSIGSKDQIHACFIQVVTAFCWVRKRTNSPALELICFVNYDASYLYEIFKKWTLIDTIKNIIQGDLKEKNNNSGLFSDVKVVNKYFLNKTDKIH